MNEFFGGLIILVLAFALCQWSKRRDRLVMSRFVANAKDMIVVFNGKKYKCTRDNGKFLQLQGLRSMVSKKYCRPL